jgi:hypothetical protein
MMVLPPLCCLPDAAGPGGQLAARVEWGIARTTLSPASILELGAAPEESRLARAELKEYLLGNGLLGAQRGASTLVEECVPKARTAQAWRGNPMFNGGDLRGLSR